MCRSTTDGSCSKSIYFSPSMRRPTADGRWAGCGDPYDGGDLHGSGVKAEPITFKPRVVFDIRNVPEFVRERKYPLPLFRYENETAVCLMGNYPDALFRVMKEGVLTARGVFPRR